MAEISLFANQYIASNYFFFQQQGKVDFQARINQETTDKLDSMGQQIQCHKNDVINRVLDLVYDIKPELHTNFRP